MTEILPYEIHLTVSDVGRAEFEAACLSIKAKPVLLELQSRTHGLLTDAMTSSRVNGTFQHAQAAMAEMALTLRAMHGMAVTRYKIETVPWHPLALNRSTRTQDQYMESHMQLRLRTDLINSMSWRALQEFCIRRELHLSRNIFKEYADEGIVVHMATLRCPDSLHAEFAARVQCIKQEFSDVLGIVVGKTEVEFAILDTRPSHDVRWMT